MTMFLTTETLTLNIHINIETEKNNIITINIKPVFGI